jgi:hypothetical protein
MTFDEPPESGQKARSELHGGGAFADTAECCARWTSSRRDFLYEWARLGSNIGCLGRVLASHTPTWNRHTTFSECFLSGRVPAAGEVLSGRTDGTPIAASIMLTPPRNVEFQRNTAMSRGNEQYSNYNSALYTVYGSSLGLLALLGRSSKLRVVTALAGAGLLVCAALSRKGGGVTTKTRSSHMDQALEESFPASDPPTWRSPDVPPSNAEAKWQAHREATDDIEGV